MKIKNLTIKIIFTISVLLFIYFFYKDANAEESLKGYYIAQGYFFIFLSLIALIVFFLDKNIQIYFNIIFFSFIFSLYLFEGYFFYIGKTKLIASDNDPLENKHTALQTEINEKGGYIWNFVEKNNLMSLSGISNSKIIFCNEDDFYSTYNSDRHGLNNPDHVWDKKEVDVVLMGDSFAHGACVNGGDDITSHIRKLSNLNAINLGWPRTGPLGQYASYLEFIEQKPKYIFWIFFGSNDVVDLKRELKNITLSKYLSDTNFKQNLINRRAEIDLILKDNHNNFMQKTFKHNKVNKFKNFKNFVKLYKTRQFLLYKISGILNTFENNNDQQSAACKAWVNINAKENKTLDDYTPEIVQERNFDKYIWTNQNCVNEALKDYFNIVYKMKKVVDSNNTKLIIIYFSRPENMFSKKAFVLQKMKKVIFEKMKQNNIDFIDIDDAIKKNFTMPSSLYPKHHPGFHYNKLGYEFIGEKIVEYINKN